MRPTSKKVKFIWTSNEEQTFREIKNLFLQTNVLSHPIPDQPYYPTDRQLRLRHRGTPIPD